MCAKMASGVPKLSAGIKPIGQARQRATGTLNRALNASLWAMLVWGSLSTDAFARDAGLRSGSALEESPVAAASGQFAAIQIATTDPDRLVADWQKPSTSVALVTTTHAFVNQPIVTFIIFRGCRADASGNCQVTVDFETFGPDGKRYDSTRGVNVWVGHPPTADLSFQLSETGYDISFEPEDPLGSYHVHAIVTDHVAGIVLDTEQVLTVTSEKQTTQSQDDDARLCGPSARPL